MARYIDADKISKHIRDNFAIDKTKNADICFAFIDFMNWLDEQPTADVVEVKHGTWHIMRENPLDETDAPREAGWYRIITADGEEMTDYFFGKPTMTASGVAYWRKCKKIIRAWAKMDVPDTNDGKKGIQNVL